MTATYGRRISWRDKHGDTVTVSILECATQEDADQEAMETALHMGYRPELDVSLTLWQCVKLWWRRVRLWSFGGSSFDRRL